MRRLPRQRPVEVRTSLPTFPGPCSPARLNSTAGLCQAAARRVPGAAVGGAAAPAARGRADQVPAQGGQAGDAAQEGDEEEEAEGQVVSQGPVVLESKCAMVSITPSARTHSASSQALALACARAIAGSHAAIACGVRTHPSCARVRSSRSGRCNAWRSCNACNTSNMQRMGCPCEHKKYYLGAFVTGLFLHPQHA